MRTVSFSDDKVQKSLNNNFVCTHTSTEGDPSAGKSLKHAPTDAAGLCGRGAGRQNVQTVFMTPENEIFHVVTGYLDAKDLLAEVQFADKMYDRLGRSPKRKKETVVAMHTSRLQELGFQPKEINASENMMSEMLATGFSPEDLGMNLSGMTRNFGGRSGNMFGEMNRQRVLKDHRFVMKNPLLDRVTFDAAPQELVGHNKSFFGSVGGPHTQMIQNMNQRMQR